MGGDDQAVRPAVVVVVAGGEVEHRGGELVGERGAIVGGAEADLGVDRERRQPPPGRLGVRASAPTSCTIRPASGDQVAGGQAVARPARVAPPSSAMRGGRDDVAGGGRAQHPLRDPAPGADLGQLDEAVRLERVEVVVDLLAGRPSRAASAAAEAGS